MESIHHQIVIQIRSDSRLQARSILDNAHSSVSPQYLGFRN